MRLPFPLLLPLLFVAPAFAAASDSAPETEAALGNRSDPEALKGKPYPEFWRPKENATPEKWPWALPFLAQKVIDKGFQLPRPYGVSLIYFHQTQAVDLGSLEVAFDPAKALQPIGFVHLDGSHVETTSWQVKTDAWVLPFLNLFGTIGTTRGTGQVPIGIASDELFDYFIPGVCDGPGRPNFCEGSINATAPIDYHGFIWGLGGILAGGWEDFFGTISVTYANTDVNVSDSDVNALNVSPRVGYHYPTKDFGKFGFYVGANYLKGEFDLTGTYSLPLAGTSIGRDVPVQYKIHEKPKDRWNGTAGVNWEMSEHVSALLEIGYSANRDTQTFNFNYRF